MNEENHRQADTEGRCVNNPVTPDTLKSPLELIYEIEKTYCYLSNKVYCSECKAKAKLIKQMCEWLRDNLLLDEYYGIRKELTLAIEKAKEILK